jgi:lipopolysaccharide transport system ATP-binding protein
MKPAIRVENLSKHYRIGTQSKGAYRNLTESIVDGASGLWRGLTGQSRSDDGEGSFWALRDVSFEVQPGEVVGIIGRNGAGKSTLLKILSRITEPTSGRALVRGRMGSLLEVGTGFHTELTGRENIFLNGSILGMSRAEVQRKFDEIVAFAEVEEFLDTPVKRYSSGMYVRLAFAVAAHLEPEILVVDEVLAVGDYAFQNKCLKRMEELGRRGGTVLLVSHTMSAVATLCSTGVCLDRGQIKRVGQIGDVIREYENAVRIREATLRGALDDVERERRPTPLFKAVSLIDEKGNPTGALPLGGRFRLRLVIESPQPLDSPRIGIGVDSLAGQRMLSLHNPLSDGALSCLSKRSAVVCEIPSFPLAPGEYTLKLALTVKRVEVDAVECALVFRVTDSPRFEFHRGLCVAPAHWAASSM